MTWSVAFGIYYLMSAIIIIQNMNKRKEIVECFKFIGISRQEGPLDCPYFKNMFYFQFFWMFIVTIIFAIACGVIAKDYTGKSYVVFFIGWFLFLTERILSILSRTSSRPGTLVVSLSSLITQGLVLEQHG